MSSPFGRTRAHNCDMPRHISDNDPSCADHIQRRTPDKLKRKIRISLQHGRSHAPSKWRRFGIAGRNPCPARCSEPSRLRRPLLSTLRRNCRRRRHRSCTHRYSVESYSGSWLRSKKIRWIAKHSSVVIPTHLPYADAMLSCDMKLLSATQLLEAMYSSRSSSRCYGLCPMSARWAFTSWIDRRASRTTRP